MHRAAWVRRLCSGNGSYTSFQSRIRTGIGRRVGASRRCFMKPVMSPMCGLHDHLVDVETLLLGALDGGEDPLVILGEDLDPALAVPVGQQPNSDLRAGLVEVARDDGLEPGPVLGVERVEV